MRPASFSTHFFDLSPLPSVFSSASLTLPNVTIFPSLRKTPRESSQKPLLLLGFFVFFLVLFPNFLFLFFSHYSVLFLQVHFGESLVALLHMRMHVFKKTKSCNFLSPTISLFPTSFSYSISHFDTSM